MPITGAVVLTIFGVVLAVIGATAGASSLLFMFGVLLAVVSFILASRDFFIYRAQRRHLESKRNAKLDVPAHLPHAPDSDSKIEAFLDSQPPKPKS